MRMTEDDLVDRDMLEAYKDSEKEIFADVFPENDALDPYDRRTREQEFAELNQPEGWDGQPLSDMEVAERNISGGDYDRPVERDEIAALRRQLDEERARRERVELDYMNWVQEPKREEEMRRARENAENFLMERGIFTNNQQAHDALVGELVGNAQRVQQLEHAVREQSLVRAHEKYGEEFDRAHHALTSLDPRNPAARGLAQQVWDDPNPGEALYALRENPLLDSLRHRQAAPFLPESYRNHPGHAPRASRAAQSRGDFGFGRSGPFGEEVDRSGFDDRDTNDFIFDSVWD